MARVLVLGYCVVPGPDRAGVQLPHVIRALASRFTVDVLTMRAGELAYVERFHKTRMLRVPVPDGDPAARIEAFRRAVRRQLDGADYDVVHFRDIVAGAAVMERRAQLGYGTVFHLAASVQGDPRWTGALAERLAGEEMAACQAADLVITASDVGRRYLLARLPADRAHRVVAVPPGVDCDRFDVEAVDAAGPPVVLYTGPVAQGQGVRVLLRAWRDVVQSVSARLCLVGPVARDFMDPLASAIDQLGLGSTVEVFGAVDNDELPRLISRAAVCVLPAAHDPAERPLAGPPTRLLEHLACGRAVLAPRVGSVREVVQDGVEGMLFDAKNPRDLADKLLRLLADAPLRQRLGEAGQRRVRSRYPASALRRRLVEAYAALLPPSAWSGVGLGQRPRLPEPVAVSVDASNDTHELVDIDAVDTGATLITAGGDDDVTGDATPPREAWLVIGRDGAVRRTDDDERPPPRPTPELASYAAAPEERTLSATLAAPAPTAEDERGGRFVAGELEAKRADPFPFVAAGQLLGPPDSK